MRCPDCGHNNPPENRYCGICGHGMAQVSDPSAVAQLIPAEGPGPVQAEPVAVTTPRPEVRSEYAPPRGYGFIRPEAPVSEETLVTPPAERMAPPHSEPTVTFGGASDYRALRRDKPNADVEPTATLGGPSFLGLSGPAEGSQESYSYLLDPEENSAHVGRWVGALILVVLAVTVYLKWQPLKTWVVNTAMSHTAPPTAPKPVPATDQPTITTGNAASPAAGTPSGSPPIETSVNTPQNELAQQDKDTGQPAKQSDEAGAPADKAAAGTDKPAGKSEEAAPDKAAGSRKAPHSPQAEEPAAAAGEVNADTRERLSAARTHAAAPVPQGNQLVVTGEKYLYGHGVPRDCDQALTYFRAAAGKNNARAFSHLGALYATGECVAMDRAQAYSYFSRALAADRRNPYYERNLTMLWRDMSGAERQRATSSR